MAAPKLRQVPVTPPTPIRASLMDPRFKYEPASTHGNDSIAFRARMAEYARKAKGGK